MGRVGVVHQHASVKCVGAQGFSDDAVLDGDAVGIGNFDSFIGGVADGNVVHDGVAGVAEAQTVVGWPIDSGADADVLENPVFRVVCRSCDILILERLLVRDKATDGDAAR